MLKLEGQAEGLAHAFISQQLANTLWAWATLAKAHTHTHSQTHARKTHIRTHTQKSRKTEAGGEESRAIPAGDASRYAVLTPSRLARLDPKP